MWLFCNPNATTFHKTTNLKHPRSYPPQNPQYSQLSRFAQLCQRVEEFGHCKPPQINQRDGVISSTEPLTQTKSRGRERKSELVERVQRYVDEFERCFVISFENMRTAPLKELRAELSDCRFVLGKNKVLQRALGRTAAETFRPGSWRIGDELSGQRGVLFTNRSVQEILEYFDEYAVMDYSRAGATATETVVIPEGPITGMTHSMTPTLTRLGLPVELRTGVIHVTSDHTICEAGETLSTKQAQLLKLFEKPQSVFHIDVESVWDRASGKLEQLESRDLRLLGKK